MRSPRGLAAPRGLWVAFLGPDGVGKSAVIERLQHQLEPSFDGVTVIHFRPQFRRHPAAGPPVLCPHAKRPRSLLVSLGKLVYWLSDCWFGYLFVILPGKNRGRLIVFDRYFPDVLVDPLRYRLPEQSAKFTRWLSKLAPRPDLYILLDAPAEVVQTRKAELSMRESRRQRIAYLKMFERVRSKLLVNADRAIDDVVCNIALALHSFSGSSCFAIHEPTLLADL